MPYISPGFSTSTSPIPDRRINRSWSASVPRPPNAFILFRSAFMKNENVLTEDGNRPGMATLSKIIGITWRALPAEGREVWERKADEKRVEHRLKYSDYSLKTRVAKTTTSKMQGPDELDPGSKDPSHFDAPPLTRPRRRSRDLKLDSKCERTPSAGRESFQSQTSSMRTNQGLIPASEIEGTIEPSTVQVKDVDYDSRRSGHRPLCEDVDEPSLHYMEDASFEYTSSANDSENLLSFNWEPDVDGSINMREDDVVTNAEQQRTQERIICSGEDGQAEFQTVCMRKRFRNRPWHSSPPPRLLGLDKVFLRRYSELRNLSGPIPQAIPNSDVPTNVSDPSNHSFYHPPPRPCQPPFVREELYSSSPTSGSMVGNCISSSNGGITNITMNSGHSTGNTITYVTNYINNFWVSTVPWFSSCSYQIFQPALWTVPFFSSFLPLPLHSWYYP